VALVDIASELKGWIAEIDYLLAVKLVNRAWRDIRDSRLWSWLLSEGVFVAPPIISSGTVTATQYSPVITLSAAALTALSGLSNPLLTQRQFRCGPSNGGVYNITALNPTASTITLDRIYQEPSVANAPYQIYRCYYQPADMNGNLITDFLTFVSMINPDLGYRISRRHLRYQKVEIDGMDPLRANQGLARYVATYKFDQTNNVPLYELWPHPTYASGYVYLMRRRGVDLAKPADDVPGSLNPALLTERSRYYAALWAAQNVGRFPQLKGVDWRFTAAEANANYNNKLLPEAQRQDDEIFLDSFLPSQWADDLFVNEDIQVSTLLSAQSASNWQGG